MARFGDHRVERGEIDKWMAIYSPDAVHEFPFAPSGGLRRLEGKQAINTFMVAIGDHIEFGSFSDVRLHGYGDDVVIEAEGHHRDASTGAPFDLSYVWIVTRRNGRVVNLRDYTGPRRPAPVLR